MKTKVKISKELYNLIEANIGGKTFVLVDNFKDGVFGYFLSPGFGFCLYANKIYKNNKIVLCSETLDRSITRQIDTNMNRGLFAVKSTLSSLFEIIKEDEIKEEKIKLPWGEGKKSLTHLQISRLISEITERAKNNPNGFYLALGKDFINDKKLVVEFLDEQTDCVFDANFAQYCILIGKTEEDLARLRREY